MFEHRSNRDLDSKIRTPVMCRTVFRTASLEREIQFSQLGKNFLEIQTLGKLFDIDVVILLAQNKLFTAFFFNFGDY